MWRGGSRFGMSVAAPFVWRCPSNLAVAPFPHPAHRTGHADCPHPALGQAFRRVELSPTGKRRHSTAHLKNGSFTESRVFHSASKQGIRTMSLVFLTLCVIPFCLARGRSAAQQFSVLHELGQSRGKGRNAAGIPPREHMQVRVYGVQSRAQHIG
jgi:hypothetical protein